MKVMVVGGGAREHALVWKIAMSPMVTEIFAVPGNAGTAYLANNINLQPTDIEGIVREAVNRKTNLVVIGPEAPLALGIVDRFESLHIPVVGPTKQATQVESSKVFARKLMQKHGIPCPEGKAFDSFSDAMQYVRAANKPVVIKADGLAGGKGVIVTESQEEAVQALSEIMQARKFGAAGDRVVIEERLQGREVSLLAFTDGLSVVPMVPACDYKKAFDGDRGPNTGGMGSYSPPGFFDDDMKKRVTMSVLEPAVAGMAHEGMPYKGILYAGLMITEGGIKVLEFNARFGDPEAQAILPRLETDLLVILEAIATSRLRDISVHWNSMACVGVVMASAGYPDNYMTGFPIEGLDTIDKDVLVFHGGTKKAADGTTCTGGGRVLTVTGTAVTMSEAYRKVYSNVSRISFQGGHYRKDIAAREVK